VNRPVAVLIGPPGAGKSTVGPLLAELLGAEFIETDQMVEAAVGKPVGTVFLALAGPSDETVAERAFAGERAAIRAAAVEAMLDILKRECAGAITALRSL